MSDEHEEREHFLHALGGRHGIADSSLPGLAFVIAYTASGQELDVGDLDGGGARRGAVRDSHRRGGRRCSSRSRGSSGSAIAAFVAKQTGRAEDFFLPGLLLNLAYAAGVSDLDRGPLAAARGDRRAAERGGDGVAERSERLRLYSRASWIWVGVFTLRLAVQLPLYFADELVALGVAKTAMGFPVFALAAWLSYLVLREGGWRLNRQPS